MPHNDRTAESLTDDDDHDTNRQMRHRISELEDDLAFEKAMNLDLKADNAQLQQTIDILRRQRDAQAAGG